MIHLSQLKTRCFYIERSNEFGSEWRFVGTGFFISPEGYFFTARHNIDWNSLDQYRVSYKGNTFAIGLAVGNDYSDIGDIACLKLIRTSTAVEYFDDVGAEHVVEGPCFTVGYTIEGGGCHVLNAFIVKVGVDDLVLRDGNLGIGMSGSPVVSGHGRVLGVLSQIDRKDRDISYASRVRRKPVRPPEPSILDGAIIDAPSAQRFAAKRLKSMRDLYRDCGNPLVVAPLIKLSIDAIPSHFLLNNFSALQLHRFLGYVLVNHHEDFSVLFGREWLRRAQELAENFSFYTEQVDEERVKALWLEAITFKQQGDRVSATRICESVLGVPRLPLDLRIRLRRELSIVNNDRSGFDQIVRESSNLGHRPIERSHTLRRALEYFSLSRELGRAKAVVGDAVRAFQEIQANLDPIYHVQMQRVLYSFLILTNERDLAERVFRSALGIAMQKSLIGQQRALVQLHAREIDPVDSVRK